MACAGGAVPELPLSRPQPAHRESPRPSPPARPRPSPDPGRLVPPTRMSGALPPQADAYSDCFCAIDFAGMIQELNPVLQELIRDMPHRRRLQTMELSPPPPMDLPLAADQTAQVDSDDDSELVALYSQAIGLWVAQKLLQPGGLCPTLCPKIHTYAAALSGGSKEEQQKLAAIKPAGDGGTAIKPTAATACAVRAASPPPPVTLRAPQGYFSFPPDAVQVIFALLAVVATAAAFYFWKQQAGTRAKTSTGSELGQASATRHPRAPMPWNQSASLRHLPEGRPPAARACHFARPRRALPRMQIKRPLRVGMATGLHGQRRRQRCHGGHAPQPGRAAGDVPLPQ